MTYTVVIQETERGGWFWRVAEDVPNGRGWSGDVGSRASATERALERLREVTATDESQGGKGR